jgi:alkylhydroperoxidase family enzyme
MSNPLMQVLASRWLALAAMVTVIALGLALTATSLIAANTEAALRRRIAELTLENRKAGAIWGAKLAACETGAAPDRGRLTAATLSNEARAKAMAQNAPAGFDVCARMESADQAVLETLK